MKPSRRHLLALLIGAFPAGVLVGMEFPGKDATESDNSSSEIPDAGEETTNQDVVRGQAEQISIEHTVQDSEIEYLAEDDAVRYVSAYSGTGPSQSEQEPIYETVPFEAWGRSKAASLGAIKVDEILQSNFENHSGVAVGKTHRDGNQVISVTKQYRSTNDQNESPGSFEQLTAVTPRSVTVTLHLQDASYTTTLEVWVTESVQSPV